VIHREGPGGERLAREPDGRWTLDDRPIHAGDVLELRTYSHGTGDAAWERVRFEWAHREAGVFPMLYLGEDDPVVFLDVRTFAQLPLRWPD
jgi:hypothetical protein